MNIDDHVESCLGFFQDEAEILGEILFVGAWARYFYRDLFKNEEGYYARLATKDVDVLLDRKKKRGKREVDVHKKLVNAGYESRFFQSKLIKYYRDDLELEFLIPALGKPSEHPVDVNAYNIKAQELAYLQMLWKRPISVSYGKYKVRIPDPMDFAIHKLIISYRRAKEASAEQDRRDAEEVLFALSKKQDFENVFQDAVSELKKKSVTSVQKGISTFLVPDLRGRLQSIIEGYGDCK